MVFSSVMVESVNFASVKYFSLDLQLDRFVIYSDVSTF